MSVQNIDFLPKCSVCGVGLYCVGIETFKLQCGHLFCQLCVRKMKWNGTFWCWFDQCASTEPENWGERGDYLMQLLGAYGNGQELEGALGYYFPAKRTNLPCSRAGCQGHNCDCIHLPRDYWKGLDCPLSYQCPNSSHCLFKHPNEASTLPVQVSLPQPVVSSNSPYDIETVPKPIKQWRCSNCQTWNNNSGLKCGKCKHNPGDFIAR